MVEKPPKIDIPDANDRIDLEAGIEQIVRGMENLAAWMYETAQYIERGLDQGTRGADGT